jgi:hypothetical protein
MASGNASSRSSGPCRLESNLEDEVDFRRSRRYLDHVALGGNRDSGNRLLESEPSLDMTELKKYADESHNDVFFSGIVR